MEIKGGTNKVQDIRIENFDVAYGDRVLLHGADLTLAFGRRYGLIGRNGLGKTTLLRMISRYCVTIDSVHSRVGRKSPEGGKAVISSGIYPGLYLRIINWQKL